MFKICRRFIFTLLIAHWMYAEVHLMWPDTASTIKTVFHTVQIPTHDRWAETVKTLRAAQQKYVLKAKASQGEGIEIPQFTSVQFITPGE